MSDWQLEKELESMGLQLHNNDDGSYCYYSDAFKVCKKLMQQIEALKAELAKERSVVDFYANTRNWETSSYSVDYTTDIKGKIVSDDLEETSHAFHRGGKRARQRQRERK